MANRPHWYRDDKDHITRAPRRRPPTRSKVPMRNCPLCHGEGDVLGNQANVTGGQGMRCPVCIGRKQLPANDSIFNHPKMVRNIRDKAVSENFRPSQIETIQVGPPSPKKAVRQEDRIEEVVAHEQRRKAKFNRQGFSFKRFLIFLLVCGTMAAAAGFVLFPDEAKSVVQTLTERKIIIIR